MHSFNAAKKSLRSSEVSFDVNSFARCFVKASEVLSKVIGVLAEEKVLQLSDEELKIREMSVTLHDMGHRRDNVPFVNNVSLRLG